jgi:hypothetical protein
MPVRVELIPTIDEDHDVPFQKRTVPACPTTHTWLASVPQTAISSQVDRPLACVVHVAPSENEIWP